nr:hypothetical protein [Microbacterium sp. 69-10]
MTASVREGRLMRLRRGAYVSKEVPNEVVEAVRSGGRVTCLTLLRLIGVFVLERAEVHIHMPPHLSRSRHRRPDSAVLHWGECQREGQSHVVSLWDAVRQSVRCQTPRAAIATLDSVLHHRLLTSAEVESIFRTLPLRFQVLSPLIDSSAESGPETFMRLLLRSLGLSYETQVRLPGVGRVDFVVEGWLVIECDSREFHEGWEKQVDDRRRDLAAAELGYVTIRPLASDIFGRPNEVKEAVKAVVEAFGTRVGEQRAPQLRRSARETAVARRTGQRKGRFSGVMAAG